jgi:hypothetical protein
MFASGTRTSDRERASGFALQPSFGVVALIVLVSNSVEKGGRHE